MVIKGVKIHMADNHERLKIHMSKVPPAVGTYTLDVALKARLEIHGVLLVVHQDSVDRNMFTVGEYETGQNTVRGKKFTSIIGAATEAINFLGVMPKHNFISAVNDARRRFGAVNKSKKQNVCSTVLLICLQPWR